MGVSIRGICVLMERPRPWWAVRGVLNALSSEVSSAGPSLSSSFGNESRGGSSDTGDGVLEGSGTDGSRKWKAAMGEQSKSLHSQAIA